ncbi:MAG TPA: DUF4346 domain-containing protein [Candidatus Nanoarchaeia archaeon]|nr:DUF4346 domain-containing protein [Candidatus Nanoarchaeia archaeon]
MNRVKNRKHKAHKALKFSPKKLKALRKLRPIKPKFAKRVKTIQAHYDTWTEWKRDGIGYWLFRINQSKKRIEAGYCLENNVIVTLITGTDSEAMHNTIVREKLVKTLQHAAYIGHELQKAEIALKLHLDYIQDRPLDVSDVKRK